MKNKVSYIVVAVIATLFLVTSCGSAGDTYSDDSDIDKGSQEETSVGGTENAATGCIEDADGAPILEFPMDSTDRLVGLVGHNLPYSGTDAPPHGGIDLMIDPVEIEDPDNVETVRIISPINGVITYSAPYFNENAASQELGYSHLVMVECNSRYSVALMFEMFATNEELNAMQADLIPVEVGQSVSAGELIGDMIVGSAINNDGIESYKPHLDYRIVVKDPDVTVEELLQNAEDITVGEEDNAPSFLCSGEYSSDETWDALLEIGQMPDAPLGCTCPCYTGDASECGDTCVYFNE